MAEPRTGRFTIERLADHHDRADFSCGVTPLDTYLHRQAGQDARRGYATVFVAVERPGDRVAGYYTLSMSGVAVDLLPEKLRKAMPRYPTVPAVRLGRLAVASEVRGQGLGALLLIDAMTRSVAAEIAWAAMVVDAKDASARAFYQQYGFLTLADDPLHLFLPRRTIEAALAEPPVRGRPLGPS